MYLTEEEKREILSKYDDNNTSNELLIHLKRTYPVTTQKFDWSDIPLKFIGIDGKNKPLTGNKKNLVNKLYNIEEERWISLGRPMIRRTIKKFLDAHLIN